MNVAFCNSPLSIGHKTRGIGAYTKNLLKAFRKYPEIKIQEFSDISEIKDTDIIHYPFFDLFSRTLTIRKGIPTIVTIHDIIPLVYSAHYPPGIKSSINKFLQKKSLKNVSAIITDSVASKKDINKYLKIKEEKIFPVALAPNSDFRKIKDEKLLKEVLQKYNLPERFALFTGNVNWNKNLLNLSESALKAGIDLVLIGKSFEEKDNLDHPEMKSFKNFLGLYSKNPKIHILGFVEQEDLIFITNLAKVVLLPSFAEGFGLPILEAQICGIPVITSNVSSMPEVAGEGAILVNPYNTNEISEAIKNIEKDKSLREDLIEKGFENVKQFSWEKTTKELIEIYKRVVE